MCYPGGGGDDRGPARQPQVNFRLGMVSRRKCDKQNRLKIEYDKYEYTPRERNLKLVRQR